MTLSLHRAGNGVFVTEKTIACFGMEEIAFVRAEACKASLRRARICAHKTNADPLHEMLIALCSDTYVPPHRHAGKSESFHVVEGRADVCIFDEQGTIVEIIPLGDGSHGTKFYYRLPPGLYHTLIIYSPVVVILETTNGPFDPTQTCEAPFAPDKSDAAACRDYLAGLPAYCKQNFPLDERLTCREVSKWEEQS